MATSSFAPTMPNDSRKARWWGFTVWPQADEHYDSCEELGDLIMSMFPQTTYMVVAKELGEETKRVHYHVGIRINKQKSFNVIKTALKEHGLTWKILKIQLPKEYVTYCKKDGDFIEMGEFSDPKGGKNNLQRIYSDTCEEMKQGKSLNDLILEMPVRAHYKGLRKVENILASRRAREFRHVRVHIYWGEAGSGKTRTVWEETENKVFPANVGAKWWDGYEPMSWDNTPTPILFDDFYGQSLPFHLWLRYCDGYAINLPIKGGYVWAAYDAVYFTSNKCPCEWWPGLREWHWEKAEFQRRISTIRAFPDGRTCNHSAERDRRARLNERVE